MLRATCSTKFILANHFSNGLNAPSLGLPANFCRGLPVSVRVHSTVVFQPNKCKYRCLIAPSSQDITQCIDMTQFFNECINNWAHSHWRISGLISSVLSAVPAVPAFRIFHTLAYDCNNYANRKYFTKLNCVI